MKLEDKQLLLKDLCARLPYNVIVHLKYDENTSVTREMGLGSLHDIIFDSAEGKPYLRPMSSMTNDEIAEFKWLNDQCDTMPTFEYVPVENYRIYDWMNRHHLDYRGLIPIGLAIEVTEENNPYKK